MGPNEIVVHEVERHGGSEVLNLAALSYFCHRRRAALEDWVIHRVSPAHSRPDHVWPARR
jgi:hypothetical protein